MPEDQDSQPVATPEQNLIDQYEMDDSSFDPELDMPVGAAESGERPAVPASTPPADTPVVRDRDPETGRFLPLTAPEPTRPKHSRRLVQMATDLGIPQAEIDSTPNEALEDTVYHLHRQAMAHTEHLRRTSVPDQAPPSGQPVGLGEPAAPPRPEEEPDLGLDPALYDGPLLQVLKNQAKQIQALQTQLSQQERARANETLAERIDRSFERHHTHLGKGSKSDMKADSSEYLRRMAVLALVDRLGEKGGSLEARIDKAVETLYGEAKAPPEHVPAGGPSDELAKRRDVWNNAAVARPTQRAGLPEPKGSKRAEKAVAQHLRDQGISLEDMTEENGLPD